MNVEQALIELGESPLKESPYSNTILVIANAFLPDGVTVTAQTTGRALLTRIYRLKDDNVRERILARELNPIRSRDSYRTVMLAAAGVIGVIGILLAFDEMTREMGEAPGPGIQVLQNFFSGLLGVAKALLGL